MYTVSPNRASTSTLPISHRWQVSRQASSAAGCSAADDFASSAVETSGSISLSAVPAFVMPAPNQPLIIDGKSGNVLFGGHACIEFHDAPANQHDHSCREHRRSVMSATQPHRHAATEFRHATRRARNWSLPNSPAARALSRSIIRLASIRTSRLSWPIKAGVGVTPGRRRSYGDDAEPHRPDRDRPATAAAAALIQFERRNRSAADTDRRRPAGHWHR